MSDYLIAILILYVMAVIIVGTVSLLLTAEDKKICLLTPSEIHENTNLNWFGCVFVWFLEFLINPIMWVCIAILKFIIWLFTVGRK